MAAVDAPDLDDADWRLRPDRWASTRTESATGRRSVVTRSCSEMPGNGTAAAGGPGTPRHVRRSSRPARVPGAHHVQAARLRLDLARRPSTSFSPSSCSTAASTAAPVPGATRRGWRTGALDEEQGHGPAAARAVPASSAEYQRVRRVRACSRQRPRRRARLGDRRGLEPVADAPDRLDQRRLAQLLAQPADVHLDQIRRVRELEAPDALDDRVARDDPAGVPQQRLEDAELAPGQVDRPPAALDEPRGRDQRQVADPQVPLAVRRVPPEQGAQPGQQLVEGERLGQVVVGAAVEPEHLSVVVSRAVSSRIGVVLPAARRRRQTASPSTTGSCTSSTMAS